jgi:hypothetical protein
MKTLVAFTCAGLVGLAALAPAPVLAKGKCVMAGGTATGLTQEIAKAMATTALGTSISNYGGKAKGKVSMSCDNNVILATCTAKQRACK